MAKGIVIGGKTHLVLPVAGELIPVFGPEDHGMEFKPGEGHNKRRQVDVTLGVYHWTGSENSVETMFRTLNKRKLGVEFAISPFGSIFQFCDPMEVDTADAGRANKISFGVEMVNAGIRRANTLWREPRYRKPKLGKRIKYDTKIHGRNVKCWDFYPKQTAAAFALNSLLSEAIPTYGSAVCTQPCVVEWNSFIGAVGHYNVSKRKIDPGTRFMSNLAAYMFDGTLPPELSEREEKTQCKACPTCHQEIP